MVKSNLNMMAFKEEIMRKAKERLTDAIQKGLDWLANDMMESKTGRRYRIAGRDHIASAVGETPAFLYGDLVDSLNFYVEGDTIKFGVNAGMNEGLGYSMALEVGTKRNLVGRSYMLKTKEKIREFLNAN